MATVNETVESGILPITLDLSEIGFFENNSKIIRTFLNVNSLELGVLTYRQYRFVAGRTKLAYDLVKRHLDKLFLLIPDVLAERPETASFTVPAYPKLLMEGDLFTMLEDKLFLYPEISASKICIELSADILYEDLDIAADRIDEIRSLGVKVAISEVGDEFCPIFRLSEITFDYALMDPYSTASLGGEDAERVAGSLIKYLHHLDVKVIAPGLVSKEIIDSVKELGADGYTSDPQEAYLPGVGGDSDGE